MLVLLPVLMSERVHVAVLNLRTITIWYHFEVAVYDKLRCLGLQNHGEVGERVRERWNRD